MSFAISVVNTYNTMCPEAPLKKKQVARFYNMIDTLTCCSIIDRATIKDVEWAYKKGLLVEYTYGADVINRKRHVKLVLSIKGNVLADLLFGTDKLPPNDLNGGVNRKAFAEGMEF